jgi:hypothetical protein
MLPSCKGPGRLDRQGDTEREMLRKWIAVGSVLKACA